MTAPIPVRVLRYQCPFCSRSASRPGRTREHMARCWRNPEARGCKTCKNFEPFEPGEPEVGLADVDEGCAAGVNLTGHPACTTCGGYSDPWNQHDGCIGYEVKPGPIVHCEKWEASQ